MKQPVSIALMAVALCVVSQRAAAQTVVDYGVRAAAAVLTEKLSERDQQQDTILRKSNSGYVDLKPWLKVEFGTDWALYLRGQAFAANREVTFNPDESRVPVEHFVALRELWVDYRGLTDYPNEALRVGRQRLREDLMSTLWWDQDAEAVRWFLDTTLLRVSVGAAEQLATFRSDIHELSPAQEGRSYVFGSAFREWMPGHELGGRAVYVKDRGGLPGAGEGLDGNSRSERLRSLYLSLRAAGGQTRGSDAPTLAYWAEASWLGGRREQVVESAERTVAGVEMLDVSATAVDAGVRFRAMPGVPAFVGASYASGSGGRDGDDTQLYRQTGLHSNRSRHAGIRTPIHRFNEVLRADLSNLQALSAFASYAGERVEGALIYERFRRDDADDGVISNGLELGELQLDPGKRDIGSGWDAVAAYYFEPSSGDDSDFDLDSSLRLRASLFQPGDAVSMPVAKDFYRIMLEWVVRL